MLPSFLGIGVPRAGTTWLYKLLAAHPDVYVPLRRKEVHFFDSNYERGVQWYKKFFPPDDAAARYQAIGEITPHYLFHPRCPERIAATLQDPKLIVILRNPVDRAYSHYLFRARVANYTGSFEGFLSSCREAIQWGFYSQGLRNYLRYFSRDKILVLIYEIAVVDVHKTMEALANFLGIAVARFPPNVGFERINPSYIPKWRSLYALATNVAHVLRNKYELDWVVNLAKRLGIKQVFGQSGSVPPMKEQTKKFLRGIYEKEIEKLEAILEIDLRCWKQV